MGGRNGSGTFSYTQPQFVPNTTISSTAVNQNFTETATALTGSVAANGETPNIGPLKATAGGPGFPAYTFNGDHTSGFYLIGPASVGLALGGVNVGTFSPTGITYAGSTLGGVPTGSVVPFAGAAAPTGWVLCDGSAISTTTFAALFAVLGTTYNTGGEPAGTFRVPDLRGRMPAGIDNMGGTAANRLTAGTIAGGATTAGHAGGTETVLLSDDQLSAHTHTITDPGHIHPAAGPAPFVGNSTVTVTGGAGNTVPTGAVGMAVAATGIAVNATAGNNPHANVQPTMVMNMIIKV